MADARQQLSQEGFSDAEADAIIRRAVELQQRSGPGSDRMDAAALEAGAEAVGVQREFVQEAIRELRAERARAAAHRARRTRTLRLVGAVVAAFLILSALFSHRALNASLAEVEAKRAQLENVLQRRHDLIPNLIAVTRASAAHEKELAASLSGLVEQARSARGFEERLALEQQLSDGVQEVLNALRSDPQASSTALFIRLSDEMAGAENRIAVERKRYNEAAAAYTRTARGFPTFVVRPLLGFPASQPYFQAAEEAHQVPVFNPGQSPR